MDIHVQMKEVALRLIHQKTRVCMAEMSLRDMKVKVVMKPLGMNVNLSLGDMQIFDTTNYPETIDSNLEYDKVVPYEMIGVGEKSKKLMEVSFIQYDPKNPEADKENNIYSYVNVEMQSIKINVL
mmetsp:Transcript_20210/g.17401  ORF Transcript_20210/g.17401 Transcript_20210/m.17401 type:complete len:125 (+) Transcript_20210:157-531(+)